MAFHIHYAGEPVLNGWTKRPASWPTREAAQGWLDYWARLHAALDGRHQHQIIEHHKEES